MHNNMNENREKQVMEERINLHTTKVDTTKIYQLHLILKNIFFQGRLRDLVHLTAADSKFLSIIQAPLMILQIPKR